MGRQGPHPVHAPIESNNPDEPANNINDDNSIMDGVLVLLHNPHMTCCMCLTSQCNQLGLALWVMAKCKGVPCSSWMMIHTPPSHFLLAYKVLGESISEHLLRRYVSEADLPCLD